MEYTTLGHTKIEISKICVDCMSFGKAGTMHDWTLNSEETDRVAMGKYDRTESQDMQIVSRVAALAKQYGVNMQQIALAWHWAKGVASPIVGATKSHYLDDAVNALSIKLTDADLAYLEKLYVPHRIVDAIDHNPADGVMLLDEKK